LTRSRFLPPAAALLLLAGCAAHRAAQAPGTPHYVLEPAWQANGIWYYPHESFSYDRTGLASVYGGGHPALTADGEAFDQDAMAAASQTLQLPAIVRVTNLRNGRQVLARVNDRGPGRPGRTIELTRRTAGLLGIAPDEAGEVRVQVEDAPSRQLAAALQGEAGKLRIDTAPRGAVTAEALPPPPGVPVSARGRPATADALATIAAAQAPALEIPLRLPETVTQTAPQPGRLWLRGSQFSRMEYARRQRAELSGLNPQIERIREGRGEIYRLRAGPFPSVAAADAALDQARARGVTDARITVE